MQYIEHPTVVSLDGSTDVDVIVEADVGRSTWPPYPAEDVIIYDVQRFDDRISIIGWVDENTIYELQREILSEANNGVFL